MRGGNQSFFYLVEFFEGVEHVLITCFLVFFFANDLATFFAVGKGVRVVRRGKCGFFFCGWGMGE